MTTPSPDRRANRYAAPPQTNARREGSGITGKAIVLVFLAILVAFLFYGYRYLQSREEINASISYVSHEIIDEDTLRVWADVTRNHPDEEAYCIIQAYDYEKAEVGRREIAIAGDGKAAIRISVDVPTNERAVAGGVYGCSSLIPPYLDTKDPQYQVR
ncbi:hypothetical protein CPHO_08135 [Corynebacterium phocae]|uniref:DUF4307 domain-containing protein n=1 Tax=Corynebacterium phocae TaxID=161895 RepID=A0A1L7D3Z7_9CORY|nr:DUF4307 domain-containing protein [Corynebacterium phocae]APT92859.1 hypothetical protein CPHO_08135 [Corynebacterium phocae]KAA8723178.1 DUF4307 domain-containing protein [Corynebacterium phocae]